MAVNEEGREEVFGVDGSGEPEVSAGGGLAGESMTADEAFRRHHPVQETGSDPGGNDPGGEGAGEGDGKAGEGVVSGGGDEPGSPVVRDVSGQDFGEYEADGGSDGGAEADALYESGEFDDEDEWEDEPGVLVRDLSSEENMTLLRAVNTHLGGGGMARVLRVPGETVQKMMEGRVRFTPELRQWLEATVQGLDARGELKDMELYRDGPGEYRVVPDSEVEGRPRAVVGGELIGRGGRVSLTRGQQRNGLGPAGADVGHHQAVGEGTG